MESNKTNGQGITKGMKILYDFQIFQEQKVGGISRYFFELMDQFKKNKETRVLFPLWVTSNYYLKKGNSIKSLLRKIDDYNFRGKYRLKSFLHTLGEDQFEKIVKRKSFDVFHPTYYAPDAPQPISPYVITVHDMIHELLYQEYSDLDSPEFRAKKKRIITNATRIIAISEKTKADLIKVYGSEMEDKIDVIYHGNSLTIRNHKTPPLVTRPYLLYVGSRKMYKNFSCFFEAVAELLSPDLHLICVGSDFEEAEKKLFEKYQVNNFVKSIKASDEDLINLYQYAQAFVFPSLYEGFGFPVLEAFSCGCPIAISDRASLPEVAGDAALYFDPQDKDSICCAIKRILSDPNLRKELKRKGYERMKFFSWEKCARQTLITYKKALNKN